MRLELQHIVGYFQIIIIYYMAMLIICTCSLIAQPIVRSKLWSWHNYLWNFKILIVYTSIFTLFLHIIALLLYLQFSDNNLQYVLYFKIYDINFKLDKLSLTFLTLVCFLFPAVIILADFNFQLQQYRFFILLLLLQANIYIFILINDLLMFYILYEFMIGLVFYILFTTSNSRGSIEAALFFFGWAVFGSILVGIAVIYILTQTQTTNFDTILCFTFTPDEIYFLNCALFLGFGSKLSIWPVWYWLPRAHVEVSAAFSLFLSCILIKVCLYGYMRCLWLLQNDLVIMPFIFFLLICVIDVTCRLLIQVDLKAIIAYGSVLHINLLMILILLDGPRLNLGLTLYIWGHSYATAGLFYATNLIEKCYNSRSTFEIAGIYQSNPAIALITIFSVITFLEFPLTFFFWGEFWLWSVLVSTMPITFIIIMFFSTVIYAIIFFRLWWGVIFGAPSFLAFYPQTTITRNDIYIFFYLIAIQYIWGIQPMIFDIFTMY